MYYFFFQAEDGIRDVAVTGVQTCALPICQSRNVGIETMFSCCGLSTGPRQIVASCSTSGNGSRLSNVALTMENIVVFAPMPSASVTIAAAVKPGFRNQVRIA